jgi:hypothetical protein
MDMLSGLIGWLRQTLANPIFIYLFISVVLFLSLGHYLGTHPAGFSSAELITKNASQNPTQLLKDPINAPHDLVAYALHLAGISWRTSIRLGSALIWIAFTLCYFWLVKGLFGRAIGLMGTAVFAATPLFLVMGRDGSGEILLYSVVVILAIYSWLVKSEPSRWGLAALLIFGSLLAYVPGMLVWLAAAAIVFQKKIRVLFEDTEPLVIGTAVLVSILILIPLGMALFKDWTLIKQLALVPAHLPDPVRILKNIAWMVLALFIKTPHHSPFLIGRLPVLSITADALLVFGGFALWSAARLKLAAYAAAVAYAVILAAINDNVNILAFAVPILAVIMTAGLRYLYIEWRKIFPRNPLAKNLALTLMWLIVLVQLIFGLKYAVSAWPSTTDTRTAYVLK